MSSREEKSQGFTLMELMVVMAILAIIIAVAVPYYISYKRTSCDQAASTDLSMLGAALRKWQSELSNMNCEASAVPADYWTDASNRIASLVGGYYHWNGSNPSCDVRIRYNAAITAFEAGSVMGSRPEGWTDARRWLFRLTSSGGVITLPRASVADVTSTSDGWQSFAVGVVTPNDTTSLLVAGCP